MADDNRNHVNTVTAGWADFQQAQRYDVDGNRRFYGAAAGKLLELAEPLAGHGLDLGCGTGFSIEALARSAARVAWTGVDGSRAMLERARGRLAHATLVRGCAERLPFADRSFDVVLANFSWHWFGPEAPREILRVLRVGGSFLATVPLRRFSRMAGNRALGAALMAGRGRYARRPSQGFRLHDIPAVLPSELRVDRLEAHAVVERFPDARTLLDVLRSRGALAAIFGDETPSAIQTPSPVDFEWPFALLLARRTE
jgi:SAM-dependent methyltransferase